MHYILLLLLIVTGAWVVRRLLWPCSNLAKIPGPSAKSWLSGHVAALSARDASRFLKMLEGVYGSVVRLRGPLGKDWLYVYDPVAVHSILSTDQASWDQMGWLIDANNAFLGPGLVGVAGTAHRKQRKMLQPAFSAKQIKEMTPLFHEVTKKLVTAISRLVVDGPADVDVLSWTGRAALELIAQGGIGHSFDPLTEDVPPHAFAEAIKKFLPLEFAPEALAYHQVTSWVRRMGLTSVARWLVEYSPLRTIQELRAVSRTLQHKSTEVIQQKKAALAYDGLGGEKDALSILLRANSAADDREKLLDDELIGQITTLLYAATDTTSNALSRTLHALSEYPDVQEKLRKEIINARDGSDLPYEALEGLPYLDAVCKETLRCYTPAPQLYRQAYRDTTIPFSEPVTGTDGSRIESVFMPKGSTVVLPLSAYNRNKALWGDDADEWRPERWLEPLPRSVEEAPNSGVYAHLLTFLGGGRSCIGFKFALLEMKVVLTLLLANFTFEPCVDKPIFWNHSGVIYPTLGQTSNKPEMWLRVARHCGSVC
ncbi:cytochrome P450 [Trametes cingulata]|nr:cytochrome P450 [Trametes cingulata]